MNKAVLDASAILALIFRRAGRGEADSEILETAVASTVNLAEVQAKLMKKGYDPEEAWEDALLVERAARTIYQRSGEDRWHLDHRRRRSYGLSLGDRSCLALAIALKAPVYTTEQLWRNLNVGIPIHVIR